jgi:ATP-dependent Zn protease
MMDDLLHTAVHEAGHAVIGRVLGMACGPATIVPDDDSEGHSITFDPWVTYECWEERGKSRGDDMHSIYIGRILTLMAGAEAERELLGTCNGGDGSDLDQIERAAVSSDGFSSHDEWKRYEPRMRRQVRRLVRKYRAKIEPVAQALIEREILSSEEVDQLVMN